MVWGHFFGDDVPWSARLSAGARGGAKAIWAMPKRLRVNLFGASPSGVSNVEHFKEKIKYEKALKRSG